MATEVRWTTEIENHHRNQSEFETTEGENRNEKFFVRENKFVDLRDDIVEHRFCYHDK